MKQPIMFDRNGKEIKVGASVKIHFANGETMLSTVKLINRHIDFDEYGATIELTDKGGSIFVSVQIELI